MDLKVRDVARLLNVSEKTIYRWAKKGVLPSYRLHDQYLFNSVELQEWAAARRHQVSPDLFSCDSGPARAPSLDDALLRGGIFHGVGGATREEVLAAVSQLPGIPYTVDRALLCSLLVGRERMASTGIGAGIAIPHPRDPLVLRVAGPTVLLCFLAAPVDFGALDGQPVAVLFTLICPTVQTHLQTLSKLAFALHDAELKALLGRAASADEILSRVRSIEGGTA